MKSRGVCISIFFAVFFSEFLFSQKNVNLQDDCDLHNNCDLQDDCNLPEKYPDKEKITFFTFKKPEITLRQNLQFNIRKNSKEQGVGFSSIVSFDMNELDFDVGTNFCESDFDFTTRVRYAPTFSKKIKIGTEIAYHFFNYQEYFYENDLLCNFFSDFFISRHFDFKIHLGFFKKFAVIFELKDKVPFLENSMIDFGFLLDYFPSNSLNFYVSFGSNSFFNYPIFFAAFTNFGAEYVLPFKNPFGIIKKISIGMEVSSQWQSFIVVVKNVDQINFKTFCKVGL